MNPKNTTLIDADSLVYIIAWDVKELDNADLVNYPTVLNKVDNFVRNILNACRTDEYMGFLKGSQPTFRHLANPSYKANRKTGSNEWLNKWDAVIKHRLVTHWNFNIIEGIEAEDAVNIVAQANSNTSVIAHIDKDLNQIPGQHYNYKTQHQYDVTYSEGQRNLFMQILMGDNADNLPGLPGVGKVTAGKILDADLTKTYWELAQQEYILKLGQYNGIIKFYEAYYMCALLPEIPWAGFDINDFKWNAYTPQALTPAQDLLPEVDLGKYEEGLFNATHPVNFKNATNEQTT